MLAIARKSTSQLRSKVEARILLLPAIPFSFPAFCPHFVRHVLLDGGVAKTMGREVRPVERRTMSLDHTKNSL